MLFPKKHPCNFVPGPTGAPQALSLVPQEHPRGHTPNWIPQYSESDNGDYMRQEAELQDYKNQVALLTCQVLRVSICDGRIMR